MKKIIIIGIIFITYVQLIAQTYNPEKAAEYASYWCYKINNDQYSPYYDPKWGGPYDYYDEVDCANFVSQCLIYGELDLSKGTDGVGTGLDGYGCIPNVQNLLLHLNEHQNTTIPIETTGYKPPTDHDVGDPMFALNFDGTAKHSYICSSLGWNAQQLHSAHTTDRCDEDMSFVFGSGAKLKFFHIKSSIPDHCFDCEENYDEEGIDCGGPCPPCQHAPKQISYTTPTTDLPANVYAIEKITAGNAAVKVLSGQNVNFYTAGTIELLPGFEVESGGTFNASPKGSIHQVTADCNEFCWPDCHHYYYWEHNFTLDNVANVDRIY